ncbi:DivIVA domain-containing protein [Vibrio harveyi]|nr:DivIVA domain-containing protein [Vibrio harveyi]
MSKKFTISQIQNKKFNIVYKGYKAEEVNDFLDEIISDYMYFEQKIHDLKNELDVANEKLENISNKNDAILVEIQEYRKQN